MNVKSLLLTVLLSQLLALPLAAQTPHSEVTLPPATVDNSSAVLVAPAPHFLSNWITYSRNNCCQGQPGGHFIGTELSFRVGPSVPLPGTTFGDILMVGWMIEGGAKAQFFNEAQDRAWTIDATLGNIYNRARTNNRIVPIRLGPTAPPINTIVDSFNQTFVGIGLGREWYLSRPSKDTPYAWRVGLDGGFRYGTCRATFDVITHRTDITHGTYAALFTDLEFPCGCCIFLGGFRTECGYTWTDILQETSGDFAALNLLFTAGLRY